MPAFLDEDMMARDPAVIGYPHVVVCMAFALRTNNELWGVHLTDPANSAAVVTQFWNWATNKGLAPAAVTDMYGCCDHRVRYNAATPAAGWQAWGTEMRAFAGLIGWTGPAHGFDTSIIGPRNGTYIELRHMAGGNLPCQIFYKRHEKTVRTGTTMVQLNGGASDLVSWDASHARFRPVSFNNTSIDGKVSLFHTGVFHEVNYALRLINIGV